MAGLVALALAFEDLAVRPLVHTVHQRIEPRGQVIRWYTTHTDAPGRGDVVTNYPDTRANRSAIFDYNAVAFELVSLWANQPTETGSR